MSIYLFVDYLPEPFAGQLGVTNIIGEMVKSSPKLWYKPRWSKVVELSTIELSTICPYSPKMSRLSELPHLVGKCLLRPLCPDLPHFVRIYPSIVWRASQEQIGQIGQIYHLEDHEMTLIPLSMVKFSCGLKEPHKFVRLVGYPTSLVLSLLWQIVTLESFKFYLVSLVNLSR